MWSDGSILGKAMLVLFLIGLCALHIYENNHFPMIKSSYTFITVSSHTLQSLLDVSSKPILDTVSWKSDYH